MNIEIFNYLNLINTKLSKQYRLGKFNPLPQNFELKNEQIKERLIFNELKFSGNYFDDKKIFLKKLKNSIKNTKKLIKNQKNYEFSVNFSEKINFYLILRLKLSKILLKNSKNQSFDENEAYCEIYYLDPIFFELLKSLFDDDFDFEILSQIENNYVCQYSKLFKIEEKQNKNVQKIAENLKEHKKIVNLSKKIVQQPIKIHSKLNEKSNKNSNENKEKL